MSNKFQVLIGLFLFDTNSITKSDEKKYRRFFKGQKNQRSDSDKIIDWYRNGNFISKQLKKLGDSIENNVKLLSFAILAIAFFVGISAAGILFYYDGSTPINVLPILAFFVLAPLTFLLVSGFNSFIHKRNSKTFETLLSKIPSWVIKKTNYYSSSTDVLYNLDDIVYEFQDNSKPVQLFFKKTMQAASIFYVSGALLWMLFNVTTTDLAFSWSSTLNISGEHIYAITNTLSFPWSSIVSEATVDLETIKNTRFFRADASNINAKSSGQWWSFIFMTIVFYSLIPRIITFILYKISFYKSISETIVKNDAGQQILNLSKPGLYIGTNNEVNYEIPVDPEEQVTPNKSKEYIVLMWGLTHIKESNLIKMLNRDIILCTNIGGLNPTSDDDKFVEQVSSNGKKKSAPDIIVFVKYWESPKLRFDKIIKKIIHETPNSSIKIIPVVEDMKQNSDANKSNWGSRVTRLNQSIGSKKIFLESNSLLNINKLVKIND